MEAINFKNHRYEPLESKQIQKINFTSEGYKIHYRKYLHEVMYHITNDLKEIQQVFEFSGEVTNVDIKVAGAETHRGGKNPLFLEFTTFSNQKVKLVYKPKSVLPEILLEDLMGQISSRTPRKLLNRETYGYDFHIQGTKFEKKDIINFDKLKSYCDVSCMGNVALENIALVRSLAALEIEDTHLENFIIDSEDRLHFIDAETYQTGISVNLKEFVYGSDSSSEDEISSQPNTNEERLVLKLKDTAPGIKERLSNHPTRLVICSTEDFSMPGLRPKSIFIDEIEIVGLDRLKDYITACFGKFLFVKREINVTEKVTFEILKQQVISSIGENGLAKIHAELDSSQELRDKNILELPSFYFHLKEKWIECPLIGERVHLN